MPGIGACLDARANVELQHDVMARVRREDVHRALPVHRMPLGAVVVISGSHARRFERFTRRVKAIGDGLPAVGILHLARAGHDDVLLPMVWLRSMAFLMPSGVNTFDELCVELHFTPRPSSRLRISFAVWGVQS